MITPEKIAIAGDWHANTKYAKKAIHWAAKQGAQAILHCGDFGYDFTPPYIRFLTKALTSHDMHLWFVDGNHENFDWLYSQELSSDGLRWLSERIAHIPRGFVWEWHGTRFMGFGGAVSVDQKYRVLGSSWWPEEAITYRQLSSAMDNVPERDIDVLITHDAPTCAYTESSALPADIERLCDHSRSCIQHLMEWVCPAFLFHGHYHRYGSGYFEHPEKHSCGTLVCGLDKDGAMFNKNMAVFDVTDLKRKTAGNTP